MPSHGFATTVLSNTFDFGTPAATRAAWMTLFPDAQVTAGVEDPIVTDVTFSEGRTMTWRFVLAPNGKIAGINSAG